MTSASGFGQTRRRHRALRVGPDVTAGAEAPAGCLGLQGFSGPGSDLRRPVRNAHRWRLWICADYVRRLSGCLLAFIRPVETGTPPPKGTLRCPSVEVRGVEPLSRTSPAHRSYNHASIMGARDAYLKCRGSRAVRTRRAGGVGRRFGEFSRRRESLRRAGRDARRRRPPAIRRRRRGRRGSPRPRPACSCRPRDRR